MSRPKVDLLNVGVPQVANRAIVPLALDAGIEMTLASLVPLAMDHISLLEALKSALQPDNPALAAALNLPTLAAILEALNGPLAAVVPADKLPEFLDQPGPPSVTARRDSGIPSQVNVTYTKPPVQFTAEIYLDGRLVKHSDANATAGFVNDSIADVPAGSHTIRVLYRSSIGQITRFGPLAHITILLLVLIGLFMPAATSQAQSSACTWPSYAAYSATNTSGEYVAWADGGAIYWMRCADLVTVQMFVGHTPTGLYFDGAWLPYILHYLLDDGSHWQISVVAPHHPFQISPPFDPSLTDTPGEAHGDEATPSSPPQRQPLKRWVG